MFGKAHGAAAEDHVGPEPEGAGGGARLRLVEQPWQRQGPHPILYPLVDDVRLYYFSL